MRTNNGTIIGGKVRVFEEGKKKSKFTMHYVIFDPKKRAVTGDEAKKMANKVMKINKAKLKDEYDVIYAKAYKARMGRKNTTFYKLCVKMEANCIFVIPKKWRKEARKTISEYFNFAL